MLINRRLIIVALTLGIVSTTTQSCKSTKDKLLGEWEVKDADGKADLNYYLEEYETILEFEKGGDGQMRSDGYDYDMDWEVKKGKLYLEFEASYDNAEFVFDVTFKKDEMTLEGKGIVDGEEYDDFEWDLERD